jgi:methionyl-tRNA formyltransferase
MRDLRIVFMGTPEFAVPSLRILVEAGFQVVGVITAPDKPKGRGKKMLPSAVKQYAQEADLKILQPTNLKAEGFNEELKALDCNLMVVVAFRMLPEKVWSLPEYGTFNLHASLLPAYRGAAPLNWAIINGEKKTGLTTFFLKHAIDTGNIIFQQEETILDSDDVGSLYERMKERGAELVLKTVEAIRDNDFELEEQDLSGNYPKAPKIFRENCQIDWSEKSIGIHNFVRGLSPYPAAWTRINDKVYKVYKGQPTTEQNTSLKAGEYLTDGKTYLKIQTADFLYRLLEIQAPGKRRMSIEDFFRGNQL